MCWRCRRDSDTPTRAVPAPYKKAPAVSRQMLSLLLCITSCIECAASCPVPYKQSLFYKLLDCVLDGSFAECRAKLHDFTLGELADLIVDSPTYRFDRRQLLINQHHALLKFTVRSQNGLQQILDKRRGIFCIFPAKQLAKIPKSGYNNMIRRIFYP